MCYGEITDPEKLLRGSSYNAGCVWGTGKLWSRPVFGLYYRLKNIFHIYKVLNKTKQNVLETIHGLQGPKYS